MVPPSDHHLAASGCLTQRARAFSSQCCSLKHYLTGISIRKKSTALMSQKGVEFACPHSWHLFTSEYLLDIYYVPGIVLGFENTTMSKAWKVFACILHSSSRRQWALLKGKQYFGLVCFFQHLCAYVLNRGGNWTKFCSWHPQLLV